MPPAWATSSDPHAGPALPARLCIMQLVLHEPEIPPNTGNVARLCAAMDVPLHLVEPLGFSLEDRYLKRAGLDYWPHVRLQVWPDWQHFREQLAPQARLVMSSSKRGQAYCDFAFQPGDCIVLGPETRGLPLALLDEARHLVRIPLRGAVRSLNMATAAGILLCEALRQTRGFAP